MTYRREWLTDYRPIKNGGTIALGDNEECNIAGEGTVLIERFVNNKWRETRIKNVLHVPKLKKNLFSVGACTNKDLEVRFKDRFVTLIRDEKVTALGIKQGNDI